MCILFYLESCWVGPMSFFWLGFTVSLQVLWKYFDLVQTDAQEQKFPATPHPSHGIAISQFCTGGPPK